MEEEEWKEFVVGLLRSYIDFLDTTRDEEEEYRYRAPLLPWYAELTEGLQNGRLGWEKERARCGPLPATEGEGEED